MITIQSVMKWSAVSALPPLPSEIPYPLSFYAKGLDGRIDQSNAGWQGRGLWSTNGARMPAQEGGKGSMPRSS